MSYSLLNFDNVTFEGKLSTMRTLFLPSADYEPSKYAKNRYMRGQAMRTMDVIYNVLRIYKGTDNSERFVGKVKGSDSYASEMEFQGKTLITILNEKNNTLYIKAGTIDENDVIQGTTLNADTKAGVMLTLMPVILQDEEAKDTYDKMSPFLEWDDDAEDWLFNDHIKEFGELLNRFSTNIESRIMYPRDCKEQAINISTDKVSMLRQADLKSPIIETYVGNPKKFKTAQKEQQKAEEKTNTGFASRSRRNQKTKHEKF